MARPIQIAHLVLHDRLGIRDGLIVDGGSDFFDNEIENEPCFEFSDFIFQVFFSIALNGLNEQFLFVF